MGKAKKGEARRKVTFKDDWFDAIFQFPQSNFSIFSLYESQNMEYLNFEIRIGALTEGFYPVAVIRSPAGETSNFMAFAKDDPAFKRRLEIISKSRSFAKTQVSRNIAQNVARQLDLKGDLFASLEEEKNAVKTLGSYLFENLFAAEIRSCFRTSLQKAREESKGLRIHLRIETPALAALPWEYLYDPAEGDFLCLSTETPLVHYLELAKPTQPLTVKTPIRILGIIASPGDQATLNIEGEKKLINTAVEPLMNMGTLELTWLVGQSWRDLQAAMQKGPWHILHFIGHGGFDKATGEGAIALTGDDGNTFHLTATDFGRLLSGHPSVRLVILNSCEGARMSETDLFSSVGASLIRRGIPAVVSMQYEITDKAALEFSSAFYESVAEGIPVDTALQEARKAMSLAMKGSTEWGTPVLHMRAPDGRLFNVDVINAIFPETLRQDQVSPEPGSRQAPTQREKPVFEPEGDTNLSILENKVSQFWIKGVLENSVQHSALIQLGLDNLPDLVDNPWGSTPIAQEQSIDEVFQQVGGSLLILGEPGAGKTILLLTLTQQLLHQNKHKKGRLFPVVFNLSSWAHAGKSLSAWMIEELSTKYLIPRKIGKQWIEDHRLLLLLDGLDEVKESRRNDCVTAINHFLQETGVLGIVVCCRFKEYIALDTKLTVNGAIRLRLLSKEKILNYVAATGESHEKLYALLQQDTAFLQLAQTPFMLSIMMKTYQDKKEELFPGKDFQSITDRRSQLIESYVTGQFQLVEKGPSKPKKYLKDQTTKWLSWVAQNMQKHNKTIFLMEELQISWLPRKMERIIHKVASIVITILIGGLIIGLIGGLIFGLIVGLISWQISGLKDSLIYGIAGGLNYGFIGGLLGGLLGGVIFSIGKKSHVITPIERTTWSLKNITKYYKTGFRKGFIRGIIFGAIIGIIVEILAKEIGLLNASLFIGLIGGFIGGLIGVITAGLRLEIPQTTATPNEGIKITFRNSRKGLLAIGLITGLLGGFIGGVYMAVEGNMGLIEILFFGMIDVLLYGMIFGIIGGLWLGGMHVIRHYLLRFFIYMRGYGPWNYAGFLDYVVDELQFMQRVGGGYIFIHRMILEHFAEKKVDESTVKEGAPIELP